MSYEIKVLKIRSEFREPETYEIEIMPQLEKRCVAIEYLEKVLGEQSVGVNIPPKNTKSLEKLAA